MKFGFILILLGAALSLPVSRPALASPPADNPLTADKGKFRILVSGQEVGQEQFEIAATGTTWTASGTSDIHNGQAIAHTAGKLVLHTDTTPAKYDWSISGPKKAAATLNFTGSMVSVELRVDGARPFTQQFTFASPQIIVLDNNLYYQYIVLARMYDWNKKGAQTFSVLVPQEMTPGSVTVESLGKQNVDGKQLDELQVKTEDLELDLYLDNGRLLRIVSPSSNAQIVRE